MYIIAKDNADTIGDLLDTIKKYLTSSIFVYDTGSTDGTHVEAHNRECEYGFYDYPSDWKHPFLDNFARARNEAMAHLSTDWVVWFDTDDILTEENLTQLKDAIHREHPNPDIDIIACHYTHFDFEPEKGSTVRVVKNKAWRKGVVTWINRIHEIPKGDDLRTAGYSINFPTYHLGENSTQRNLTIMEDMVAKDEIGDDLEMYLAMAREYRQTQNFEKIGKYADIYITEVNKLETLKVGSTRSRQRFLSSAYHFRATYHAHHKDWKRAKEDTFLGIMVDDSYPHNFIMAGYLHVVRGQYRRAIPWFLHAYNTPKLGVTVIDHRGIRVFTALGYLATSYAKIGDIPKAIEMYDKALSYYPDDRWLARHEHLQQMKDEYDKTQMETTPKQRDNTSRKNPPTKRKTKTPMGGK